MFPAVPSPCSRSVVQFKAWMQLCVSCLTLISMLAVFILHDLLHSKSLILPQPRLTVSHYDRAFVLLVSITHHSRFFCFLFFCFVLFCFVLFCFVLFCFFLLESCWLHPHTCVEISAWQRCLQVCLQGGVWWNKEYVDVHPYSANGIQGKGLLDITLAYFWLD